jgi:hypothetical protein
MPGLLRGIARTAVVAGTASAVGGRVRHRQDQKWASQEAPAAAPAAAPAPAYEAPEQRSAPPPADRLQQLKQLGDLKAQGVLTEEEFATEKAKILAS